MRPYQRPANSTGLSFIWALALFAILCGAILLLVGGSGHGADRADESERSAQAALEDLERAANALEATDYGETRTYLGEAREKLSKLLRGEEEGGGRK
ncbi:MAG: hypothetical protein R6V85_10055 [Polyangia bacterium]